METRTLKSKFKVNSWKEPKRLDEMTLTELTIMRDRAKTLSFRYSNCERVFEYWNGIEETCQNFINENKNNL